MLGVDQVSIHNDVEDSAAAFDQFRLDSRRFLNGIRQTGGLRGVVSLHAVGNADLHSTFLCFQRGHNHECSTSASRPVFNSEQGCVKGRQLGAGRFCLIDRQVSSELKFRRREEAGASRHSLDNRGRKWREFRHESDSNRDKFEPELSA